MKERNSVPQSILMHIAGEDIPPQEIDLWPGLEKRLGSSKPSTQRGGLSMFHTKQRWLMAGGLILVIVLAVLLVTPPGQAWAQSMLRFFIRGGVERHLPTQAPVVLVEVTPGSKQPTLAPTPTPADWVPFSDTCGDFVSPRCTLGQIREMVDFPVKALTTLPEGLVFIGATGGPAKVYLQYMSSDKSEMIGIDQGPRNEAEIQRFEIAENAPVETVQIGSVQGEYVLGGWGDIRDDGSIHWAADPRMQTLRWQEGEILFDMSVFNAGDGPSLDRDTIVALAQGMSATIDPAITLPTQPPSEQQMSIAEAEAQAGFKVTEPTWLPDGYTFTRARYIAENATICLDYQHPADRSVREDYASLTIAESSAANQRSMLDFFPQQPYGGRFMINETLPIGGALDGIGLYAYGAPDASVLCGEQTNQGQVLQVLRGEDQWIIFSHYDSWSGQRNFLTRHQLRRMVESMTGVQTITPEQVDPDLIPTIEEAEKLSGFHIKLPAQLPEGVTFDYASYSTREGPTKLSVSFYGSSDILVDGGGTMFVITATLGEIIDLDQLQTDQPEYQTVSLRGTEGVMYQGYWDESGYVNREDGGGGGVSILWAEDGVQYSISGFNQYPKETWLQIVESMK